MFFVTGNHHTLPNRKKHTFRALPAIAWHTGNYKQQGKINMQRGGRRKSEERGEKVRRKEREEMKKEHHITPQTKGNKHASAKQPSNGNKTT